MKKRIVALLMSVLLVVISSIECFCADADSIQLNNGSFGDSGDDVLVKQLVLYCGNNSYKETLSHLDNSLFCSQKTEAFDLRDDFDFALLSNFDCVFLDESAVNYVDKQRLITELQDYVYNGGSIFLPNCFSQLFSNDFLGIKNCIKLDGVPNSIVNKAVGTDLEKAGEIVCDFLLLFKGYSDYEYFKTLDYGYAFEVSKAVPVVETQDGLCLYALNKYGKGNVLLTNPLLPNNFNINSFDRLRVNATQRPYAATSAGAAALFKGEFTSYVSKQKHGFSLERTFGSYGTQPISWQLHYEEITGIQNGSAILFSEICKKYNQVPSFTLIRNTYKWFSKYESLSYLDYENNVCTTDLVEGVYSNGTHVVAGDTFLSLQEIENTGSYFVDLPTTVQRLFPCIVDFNNDGLKDVVCGSSDGKIYVFITKSLDNRWICDDAFILKDKNGEEIDVGSYSAPCVFDFDNDGFADIVTGDEQGNILFLKNLGNGTYDTAKVVATIDAKQSMPTFGDVDGDGQNELVVGSNEGVIYSYEVGSGYLYSGKRVIFAEDENFLSPFVCDLNGDGISDVAAGTYDGYIRRFIRSGDNFKNGGYIMADEANYKGNMRVKFGNNCTPRFFDVNGDGKDELVCGSLEYGLNVPIDSQYFPFRKELEEQIKYIKNNNFYLGVHFYTNSHASRERENAELSLHKKAFENYGIKLEGIGANQHTWYTSSYSENQTNESLRDASLLWNSGWQSSNSDTAPQSNTENVLGFPAFIDENNKMLVFNTSTLLYLDDKITDITAKYGLPFSIYYHCDFTYNDLQSAENDVKHVADFTSRHGLSFVKEDSFAKMTAAASNLVVQTVFNDDGTYTFVPCAKVSDYPLYDESYAEAVAVTVVPAVGESVFKFSSDAEMYDYDSDKNRYTITLNKNVTLEKNHHLTSDNKSHLVSVNIPCKIMHGDGMAALSFDGYEYVEIKAKGRLDCLIKGMTKEYDGNYTVFKGFNIKSASIVFE